MKRNYTIAIHRSEQVDGHEMPTFWAQCIELPEVFTDGDTVEEVKQNMKEAIALLLESTEEITEDEIVKGIACTVL
jgi:predicted RNase H-like HicB family nuclease